MGWVDGEGLVVPVSGACLQDSDENVHRRDTYDKHCEHNDAASCKWGHNCRDISVRSGESN